MTSQRSQPNPFRVPLAVLLAWLVPGLGHIYLGHRVRGIILLVAISVTFWAGVAIGGVKSTVEPHQRTAWFCAQLCTGVHAVATYAWGNQLRQADPRRGLAYWPAEEVAVVYSGVAGLLNLLVIMDVLVRAERVASTGRSAVVARPPPKKGAG